MTRPRLWVALFLAVCAGFIAVRVVTGVGAHPEIFVSLKEALP